MTSPKKASVDDSSRRIRWSVPKVDVSVNEWLDCQASISESLRLLIREAIQRDGYVDVVNRPVGQLPRRGRPPQVVPVDDPNGRPTAGPLDERPDVVDLDVDVDAESDEQDAVGADESPAQTRQADTDESHLVQVPASADVTDVTDVTGVAVDVAVPDATPGQDEPAPRPHRQASIDEVMASTRR